MVIRSTRISADFYDSTIFVRLSNSRLCFSSDPIRSLSRASKVASVAVSPETLLPQKPLILHLVVFLFMPVANTVVNKSSISPLPSQHRKDLRRIYDFSRFTLEISMMARVTIALRDLHHAGAHRIEM